MCTVTWLPQGSNQYLLTSNRDESPLRAAYGICRQGELIFPQDAGVGGTWIAASYSGRAAVVLNGAFELHLRRPPYRLSRGLMVLQYFEYQDVEDFMRRFEFQGMEPFTLVISEPGSLHELRWDEQRLHHQALNPAAPHLWASATLYNAEYRQKRQRWFEDWLSRYPAPSQQDILHWHQHAGEGDPWNDVVMNRNGLVQTVSITSINARAASGSMIFQDLLSEKVEEVKWTVKAVSSGHKA